MISLILLVIAFLLFVLAGANQTLFHQPPADLVAWGLACWALATLLSGLGPYMPILRRRGE